MKKQRLFVSAGLALLASLLMIAPAAARARVARFTGSEITCVEGAPERQWVTNNVLHVRNQVVTTRVLASDERITGTNTVVLNYNLNLSKGSGTIFGRYHLQPDQVNGAWDGHFSGHFENFVNHVQAHGRGTGELAGLHEKVAIQGSDLPAGNPCPAGAPSAASSLDGQISGHHE